MYTRIYLTDKGYLAERRGMVQENTGLFGMEEIIVAVHAYQLALGILSGTFALDDF